jgi:two-component system response regulator AtoC
MSYSVLIVDDEALTLRTISRALGEEGFDVFVAMDGEKALAVFREEKPDLVLLDVVLPGVDGIELLRTIKHEAPATTVIMMSAYHVVERAVEAMKLGAYDYLVKPFHLADMVGTMKRASELLSLRVRVSETIETAQGRYNFGRIRTENPAMREVLEVARKAAETDRTTVLIQGESGTGKEVLAKTIHYHSPRAQMQLLELNCAALPDTLLESELFGFEPGAFTDARRRKEGLLERANTGTLFLDEIGNMSSSVQAKLLNVLEQGAFFRLGGTRSIRVDVRLIAATNRNLKDAVARGDFREDLFYRLNVVPITIPPLRDRREDILPLALDMLQHFNEELKRSFTGFTREAADLMTRYPWPGNIRELKNVIERTMILAPDGDIDVAHLPAELREFAAPVAASQFPNSSASFPNPVSSVPHLLTSSIPHSSDASSSQPTMPTLREVEDKYIEEVLSAVGNNKTRAARVLGIHPTSLLRRRKKDHQPA